MKPVEHLKIDHDTIALCACGESMHSIQPEQNAYIVGLNDSPVRADARIYQDARQWNGNAVGKILSWLKQHDGEKSIVIAPLVTNLYPYFDQVDYCYNLNHPQITANYSLNTAIKLFYYLFPGKKILVYGADFADGGHRYFISWSEKERRAVWQKQATIKDYPGMLDELRRQLEEQAQEPYMQNVFFHSSSKINLKKF